MRANWRSLVFLAVVIVAILVIPSSAAHGSPGGGPSSLGGYGQAGSAAFGGGGGTGSSGTGAGGAAEVHAGYAAAEASLLPGTTGKETTAGNGMSSSPGSIGRGVQSGPGENARGSSPEAGYGLQAGLAAGPMSSGDSQASRGPRLQAGTLQEPEFGSRYASGERGEAMPGQHRGPPAGAQPFGPGSQAGRLPCGPAQTAEPLGGATGVQDPVSGVVQPQRGKKDGEDEREDAIDPGPSWPGIPFSFLTFLGYRRIGGKNVLEHEGRNRVYSAIVEHPGIDIGSLERMAGINRNTLRYHLFTLIRAGKITVFSRPGMARYFENRGMYPPFVQCLLHYLRTETPGEIIGLLWHTPGMTRAQLADALALSGPTVTRHMQNLASDGIVEVRIDGRNHHYTLSSSALATLPWYGHLVQKSREIHGSMQAIAHPSPA